MTHQKKGKKKSLGSDDPASTRAVEMKNEFSGTQVRVTDISEYMMCPGKLYHHYVLCDKGTVTTPMLLGRIEHHVRSRLAKKMMSIYIAFESREELISASYPEINSIVNGTIAEMSDSIANENGVLRNYSTSLIRRLNKEEDERIELTNHLFEKGLAPVDIVRIVLPTRIEYPVRSISLGFVGRIDAIYTRENEQVPIEYKSCGYDPSLDLLPWKLQLAAYCISLEEQTGAKVPYGELFLTHTYSRIPVVIDQDLRSKLENTIARIDSFLNKGEWAESGRSQMCEGCSYSDVCESSKMSRATANVIQDKTSISVEELPDILGRIMEQNGTLNLFSCTGDEDV